MDYLPAEDEDTLLAGTVKGAGKNEGYEKKKKGVYSTVKFQPCLTPVSLIFAFFFLYLLV